MCLVSPLSLLYSRIGIQLGAKAYNNSLKERSHESCLYISEEASCVCLYTGFPRGKA